MAVVGLLPERVRPLFLDPARLDGVGREYQKDEIGIEPFADAADDVRPGAISRSSSHTRIWPSLSRERARSRTKGLSWREWLRKTETMAGSRRL